MQYSNFIFGPKRDFLFAYIPKAACTNWKCLLRGMYGHQDYLDPAKAHSRDASGLIYLDSEDAPASFLADAGVKKYTFVRDPYSRALSAFMNKIEPYIWGNIEAQSGEYFQQVYDDVLQFCREDLGMPAVDFEGFAQWLHLSSSEYVNDEHWIPQSDILLGEGCTFSYIGRFESLRTDSEFILKSIGCGLPFPSREAVYFPGTGASGRVPEYYTRKAIDAVVARYFDDFRNFSYSLDIKGI